MNKAIESIYDVYRPLYIGLYPRSHRWLLTDVVQKGTKGNLLM